MEIATGSQTVNVQRVSAQPVNASVDVTARAAASASAEAVERTDALSAADQKKQPVDVDKVQVAVAEINQAMQMSSIGVRFEFDTTAEKMVTKVVDAVSGDLIRQMPTEEVLRMTKSLDKLQGLLVNQAV
jgi:flagellar protein FlaG